jgi:hypothetical protein
VRNALVLSDDAQAATAAAAITSFESFMDVSFE